MRKCSAVILILSLCISAAFSATVSAVEREEDLAAYWSFDEVSGGMIKDLSGNGIHLSVENSGFELEDGFRGKTLRFDANDTTYDAQGDHMKCTTDKLTSLLNGSDAITVTGYIKKYNSNAATNNIPAFKYNPGFGAIMLFPDKDSFAAQVRSSSKDPLAAVRATNVFYATKGVGNNRCGWMQFAFIIDYPSKTVKFYSDGALAFEQAVTNFTADTFTATGSGTLGVGTRFASLDEIKIYSRGLSDEEISKSFPAAVEYDFEDMESGTLVDMTGNRVDGSIGGEVTQAAGVTGNTAYVSQPVELPRSGIISALTRAKFVTVSFWMKLPENPPATVSLIMGRAGNRSSGLEVKIENGKLRIAGRSADADGFSAVDSAATVETLGSDWHHYLMKINYADKNAEIYIDGVLDNSGRMANFSQSMLDCGIAPFTESGNYDTIGAPGILLDSVKMFRRSVDEEEIRELAKELPFSKAEIVHEGTTMKANVQIANQSGEDSVPNAILMFLKYDKAGQQLLDADIAYIPQLPNGGRNKVTLTLENVKDAGEYKFDVLTWDGLTTMASLADNYLR